MPKLEVVPRKQPYWERLISDYEASAQARGLSVRTIDGYAAILNRVLLPFCAEIGVEEPDKLTKRDLERLSVSLQRRGLSKVTVRTYLAGINHFLRWAAREGEIPAPVTAPVLRQERILIDVLSRQEIEAIEAAAMAERDKLIVRVLADTGMRLGEIRRLRVDDLIAQGRERYLRVRGKGSRERLVPVVPSLFMRLQRYATRTRPKFAATDALFLTLKKSRSGDYEPLSEVSIQHLIRYLAETAGLSKRVYPHLFRHSFATQMLRRGMNPVQLRDILGHTSLAMVDRVYSHLAPTDAYQALIDALRAE